MTYVHRNHELQELADRAYRPLEWHVYRMGRTTLQILAQDRDPARILVLRRTSPKSEQNDFRVMVFPGGVFQVLKPKTWEEDLKVIDRSLGLRPGTTAKIGQARHYQPPPGQFRNQWTDYKYFDPKLDIKACIAKAQAEAPDYLWPWLKRHIKTRAYEARLEREAFDWRTKYPDDAPEIEAYFARMSKDHDCMDTFRVARVGIRQHFHHYHRVKMSGCCGSWDEVIQVGSNSYHVGFNYGH